MSSSSTQVQEEETTTTHPPSVEVLPEVLVDKLTGTVKWFNNRSGYGFITVCDGEHVGKDIFVHYKSINVKNSQYKYLVQGEYVDFTLVKSSNDKHEYQAINISGVKGGPILCETRKLMQHSEVPHPPQVYNTGRPPRLLSLDLELDLVGATARAAGERGEPAGVPVRELDLHLAAHPPAVTAHELGEGQTEMGAGLRA